MSKSLNFVVSIKLDRRSTDVNGNHPIKLRVWNRATKKVKLYSCNKFTDTTLFEKALNQGATVKGETFKLRLYLKRVLSNASDVLENNNNATVEGIAYGKDRYSIILKGGGDNDWSVRTTAGPLISSSWFITSNSIGPVNDITFRNDKYVVIGSNGIIKYSTDAVNWFSSLSVTTSTLNSIY